MNELYSLYNNFYDEYGIVVKIIIGFLVFILLYFFRNKLSVIILKLLGKIAFNKDDKNTKRESLINSLNRPLSSFFVTLGLFIAIYINITSPAIVKAFKIATILIICWALVNYLSDNLFLLFHFGEDANNKTNTTAIRFISNILKVLIIAFAVMMIISELGYNVNGLITGIGVGGLAISLAAQDAVSNLISGFIIVFEKPFIVGDMIQTSSVMGTIEEVTMRSTKIRTLEDSVITVPNSNLTNDAIINISRMDKRLISLDFGLEYSTSNELFEKCQNDIEKYLIDDDAILPNPIRVNFKSFEDSSLNINVTCYTVTSNMDEYLKILNDVNLNIKKIIEDNGASFAFPTNTVYINK